MPRRTARAGPPGPRSRCRGGAGVGRFFPRYYFQLLPLAALAGARGLALLGRRPRDGRVRAAAGAAGALRPALCAAGARSGRQAARPTGWIPAWIGTAARPRSSRGNGARPGDTLFVWGFRPELYVYTGLPAATRFLDSQPLTGVPADRHLTESQPVESESTRARRAELARTQPSLFWTVWGRSIRGWRLGHMRICGAG